MKQSIEMAFPQSIAGDCLIVQSSEEFHIYDRVTHPKRCYIRDDETQVVHFTVVNPQNKDIHFLAIDACLFDEKDEPRCDFAIFDDTVFCFVEIKDIKGRQRRNARINAQKQLSNTIKQFLNSGIAFSAGLEAIVCFATEKIYPATTAQSIDAVVEFEQEFGARFLIGNSRTFE